MGSVEVTTALAFSSFSRSSDLSAAPCGSLSYSSVMDTSFCSNIPIACVLTVETILNLSLVGSKLCFYDCLFALTADFGFLRCYFLTIGSLVDITSIIVFWPFDLLWLPLNCCMILNWL